jgi:hypothetical protein
LLAFCALVGRDDEMAVSCLAIENILKRLWTTFEFEAAKVLAFCAQYDLWR